MAENADGATVGLLEPNDAVEQNGLSRPGSTDDAEDLALDHIEIEIFMNDPLAELGQQSPDLDQDLGGGLDMAEGVDRLAHQFSSRKIRAKTASSRMMAKMAWTTAAVTRLPSDSTSPATDMP